MKKRLSTKEVCALMGKTPAYFRKDPEKHLDELKKTHYVEILKGPHSNSPTFYDVEPKSEQLPVTIFETKDGLELTKNSMTQIKMMLQAVLFDGMVPIQKELAKVIGMSVSTVKNRMSEMREMGIFLPIPTETILEHDEEGNVINEYEKKVCYWYYYDNLPNGDIRKIIDTTEVHRAYGKYYGNQMQYLKKTHGAKFDINSGMGNAKKYAKSKLNVDFGFYDIYRVPEWIVDQEVINQIFKESRHKSA